MTLFKKEFLKSDIPDGFVPVQDEKNRFGTLFDINTRFIKALGYIGLAVFARDIKSAKKSLEKSTVSVLTLVVTPRRTWPHNMISLSSLKFLKCLCHA